MNKFLQNKIISIAIFSAGFLFALSTNASPVPPASLVVDYSIDGGISWLPLSGPIFNETNFLPGDGITRLIRATNNSGQTQRIAMETINENDPDNFSSQLNLVIKEGTTEIFNNTLHNFFDQGETYLSSLIEGNTTQYDFTITFNSGSTNDYQGKVLGFDILVGFEGTEGGIQLPASGGGTDNGGGGAIQGLTILDDSVRLTNVGEFSVTITWTTTYHSTSQVIYGAADEAHILDLSDNAGSPPKYGYAHTTLEYDISPKVTGHSVTVAGLTPGTTYYFRAVSHGSLAVSGQYTFSTLAEKESGSGGNAENITNIEATELVQRTNESLIEGENNDNNGGIFPPAGEINGGVTRREASEFGSEGNIIAFPESRGQNNNSNIFLAAIGSFFEYGNLWWVPIILLTISILLFFFSYKRKKNKNGGE